MSDFKHPASRITIGSVDDSTLTVEAQYNPKELQIDKNVPWQKKNQANQANKTGLHLEFTGAEGRTMSLELLFDTYELGTSCDTEVQKLNKMASVWTASSPDENKRRPHLCVVAWGKTVENFTCVIESISTKYTMFSDEGIPLRATSTVKLKEADAVSRAKDEPSGTAAGAPAAK
jgi:hypothetical protein